MLDLVNIYVFATERLHEAVGQARKRLAEVFDRVMAAVKDEKPLTASVAVTGQLPLPEGRGLEEKMLTTSGQPGRKAID